ncbi:MAG: urease accessory protein UreF [Opitutaceae bacterium]|nr:urease accessory protein UreF [Opitutaceae bacterium]
MSAPPDHTAAAWIPRLLQTTDSFYPTGTYAHSFGLEGLVQDGALRDRATLREFLLGQVLPQLGRTDLPVAARAWDAAGAAPDWETLRSLCELGAALRGTRETRAASAAIGGQRLDFAVTLHGDQGLAAEFNRRAAAGGWPRPACVAAAIEGRALGAPREAVLASLLYGSVSSLVAAAVKLLRLGQNASHTLLAEVLAAGAAEIDAATSRPLEELGACNPWWDIASACHETADFRLFIS